MNRCTAIAVLIGLLILIIAVSRGPARHPSGFGMEHMLGKELEIHYKTNNKILPKKFSSSSLNGMDCVAITSNP